MLPRIHRLPGSYIPRLVSRGDRSHGKLATLIQAPRKNTSDPTRITVIVPYRLSKKAVERNYTRRVFREAVHKYIAMLQPGYNIIVMTKIIAKDPQLQTIAAEIQTLLSDAQLLKTTRS